MHFGARGGRPWLPLETLCQHASADPPPEAQAIGRETQAELLAALRTLGERQREILALKFAAGFTNRRIAAMLRLSEKNVSVILFTGDAAPTDVPEGGRSRAMTEPGEGQREAESRNLRRR